MQDAVPGEAVILTGREREKSCEGDDDDNRGDGWDGYKCNRCKVKLSWDGNGKTKMRVR